MLILLWLVVTASLRAVYGGKDIMFLPCYFLNLSDCNICLQLERKSTNKGWNISNPPIIIVNLVVLTQGSLLATFIHVVMLSVALETWF